MIRQLLDELRNLEKSGVDFSTISMINFCVVAINELVEYNQQTGNVNFRDRRIFEIPFRIIPDQIKPFEIVLMTKQ